MPESGPNLRPVLLWCDGFERKLLLQGLGRCGVDMVMLVMVTA
jgi:hypothetical protein